MLGIGEFRTLISSGLPLKFLKASDEVKRRPIIAVLSTQIGLMGGGIRISTVINVNECMKIREIIRVQLAGSVWRWTK